MDRFILLMRFTDEELISSVASSFTESCHSVNLEATPCTEAIIDSGPKPPPPPTESLIKTNSLKSSELLPPMPPMAEDNLGSYSTIDNIHTQESYELEYLRKEIDRLKLDLSKTKDELSKSKDLVERLQFENKKLLIQNSMLQGINDTGQSNSSFQNGMPIPEQSKNAGLMVPKGLVNY